jgi:DNA-binding GntR family transcriptional regulator
MATDAGLGRIQHTESLRDRVGNALGAAIISGQMPPGAVYSVPMLAAQFDVSATPVREALLDLEKRGFVEAIRNKGFRVTAVDPQDLGHIVVVRGLLEPEAVFQLAATFDKQDAATLRPTADRIVAGARNEDLNAYLAADHEFHLQLLSLLGNPLLVSIVADLRERTRLVGLKSLLHTDELAISAQEHHTILDLLEAHDADGVRDLMRRHIGHVAGWWSGRREND